MITWRRDRSEEGEGVLASKGNRRDSSTKSARFEQTTSRKRGQGSALGRDIRTWMLIVGGLPLVTLFLVGYLAARRALTEAGEEHLISIAEARASQIDSWLTERMTDLEVISGSADCIVLVEQASSHAEHAHVCRYLESFQTGSRDYSSLELYDLGWNHVASNDHSIPSQTSIVDPELRRLLASDVGPVLTPVESTDTGPTRLQLANRLGLPDQGPVGYVVASLDLGRTFAPILEDQAGLGRTGKVLLADLTEAGRILMPTPDNPTGAVGVLDSEILERVHRSAVGKAHYQDASGQKRLAGFTTLDEWGWLVIATMDEAEALGLLHSLERGFILAAFLTIIAVVLFSSRVSRRLSSPLAQLAAAARRIKGGRHHERVPDLQGREVAEVGRAFNEMLDALEAVKRQEVQTRTLAAVGEISSGVVHEIRNRLSSVKMNLQALEKHVEGDERYAELGQIALSQVRRVEGLLTDLLQYARPITLSPSSITVAEILRETSDHLRAEAEVKGVKIVIEDRSGGESIVVDKEKIEEAVSNLLRNAIEATGPGKQVTLRVLPGSGSRDTWAFEVEDQGFGLGETDPEEIFRPFFTTKDGGTGLGLAHARRIVELHGGIVSARDREAGGAMFRIEIPQKAVAG